MSDISDYEDDAYYEMDIPKMINAWSRRMTGLSLEELIDYIVKDLVGVPDDCSKDCDEILSEFQHGHTEPIAKAVSRASEYFMMKYGGKSFRKSDFGVLVDHLAREIYFSTIKHEIPGLYKGLANKVADELPKLLDILVLKE